MGNSKVTKFWQEENPDNINLQEMHTRLVFGDTKFALLDKLLVH